MKKKNLFRVWSSNSGIYDIEEKKKRKVPGKLRTILKSLHYADNRDRILLVLTLFCALASGCISPLNIYYLIVPCLDLFIKDEIPGNPLHINMTAEVPKLNRIGYAFMITGAITSALAMIQILVGEIVSRNIAAKIKTAYLSKMLSIEISWYDKTQEQFANTVSHDLQKVAALFDSGMTNLADFISFCLVCTITSFIASWKIALFTLGIMIVTMTLMFFILQRSKKKEKSWQLHIRKCTKIISEVVGNPRTVAAYGGEYKEIKRYESTLKMASKYGLKYMIVISAGKAFSYFQFTIGNMFSYYLCVRFYLLNDFEPSNISIILVYLNAIYFATYMMNTIFNLNVAADSTYRVMTFLDSETSYSKSTEEGIEPEKFKADISFRNVQFYYPTNLHTKVLQDLTLDIEAGKITAVVGTSGAGKSTIVSLISRVYDVTAGQILIGGVDIKKLNVSWLRNQIGVVGQEPMLFDTSIEENIRYGKTAATLEEIIEAAKVSYAHDFIEKLPSGYNSIVGERGTKLSGGQKQRIAIARAIVRKPKLLLLDEATSALDYHSEGIVQEALDNAMRDRTTLIIAHRMSTVKKADVIYALKEGRVIEKGSHSELMELKGYYYSLAKTQELEEKDKAATHNQESTVKEEMIEEAGPIVEDTLEVPQNTKILELFMKNLKMIVIGLIAIFFIITTSAFLPVYHYLMTMFYTSFTHAKEEINQIALINCGYVLALSVLIFISVILSGVLSTIGTQLWLEKLQKKAFNKIVSMDISWFDRSGNSPNECLEVLTNSPLLIESVTGERAAQVIIFVLSFLFSIVYSFLVSSAVTLISLPLVFLFVILNCLRMRSRDADARSSALATRATKVASEYVQNVKTIQILNCQKYVIDQYQGMLIKSKKDAFASIVWYTIVCSCSKALIRWMMGVILLYNEHIFANVNTKGTSLIGVIYTLHTAATLAVPALILTSQYPAARQALKRLYRIARTRPSLNILSEERLKPEVRGNIVFQDVVFSYPTREKVKVLTKLNLKIEAGKTVALVGDSGSGKSTIISLLERFYLPNKGKIMIDENDINDINVRYLRSQIGLVSQEPVLFDMTIKENILYGLEEEVTMDKIIEAAKIANIHNFIMKLPQAYDTSVGERGSKLSGGQKQRIAIARAVLRNPKILLLDEATSALDTESEKAVQEALENASIGKTTIVIAHRMSTIREADKIVVLKSGVVVEEGNHEQLMEKKGQYFNMLNR